MGFALTGVGLTAFPPLIKTGVPPGPGGGGCVLLETSIVMSLLFERVGRLPLCKSVSLARYDLSAVSA